MIINEKDKAKIIDMFPALVFEINILKGDLNFAAKFLENKKSYELLDPNTEAPIKGTFQISIDFSKSNPYREVYETGGKIQKIADHLEKTLLDLHAKQNGNAPVNVCVAGYLQEEQDISLVEFVCEIVVPYFCDLVVFEKDGYWLRGEYSHGMLGILENYQDKLNKSNWKEITQKCVKELKTASSPKELSRLNWVFRRKGKVKGHWQGFCDISDMEIRDWNHGTAFNGLWNLKENLRKMNLLSKIQL